MLTDMLKVALWQSVEKPKKITDYIGIAIAWIVVIVFIAAFNVFFERIGLNKNLVLLLRILSILVIPYVFPALNISSGKNKPEASYLFRFNSIIGILIAPIYVYKYLSITS